MDESVYSVYVFVWEGDKASIKVRGRSEKSAGRE